VVESSGARRVEFVGAGVIRTPVTKPVETRLLGIWQGIEQALAEFKPDVVAVERVFAQHNVSAVMRTAQAAGIAIAFAARRGIPVAWHTPSEVKAAVTGNGRADKPQVQFMVQRILKLAELPQPADAADALALAITHLWHPTSGSALPVGNGAKTDAAGAGKAQQQWLAAEAAAKSRKANW
jgi:crossover junction endodeoxyribonuclease RuvC